jgi:hypothetical protein
LFRFGVSAQFSSGSDLAIHFSPIFLVCNEGLVDPLLALLIDLWVDEILRCCDIPLFVDDGSAVAVPGENELYSKRSESCLLSVLFHFFPFFSVFFPFFSVLSLP